MPSMQKPSSEKTFVFQLSLSKIQNRVGDLIHKDEITKYNIEIHDNVNSLEL